jgi:hypothetical protein
MECWGEREGKITGSVVCEISSPLSLWAPCSFCLKKLTRTQSRHVPSGTEFYMRLRVSQPSARFGTVTGTIKAMVFFSPAPAQFRTTLFG